MFMNQLVKNWEKAKEQVLGKEEFVSEKVKVDFVNTIKIYYFFLILSLPIIIIQMVLLIPAVYLVLNSTHYLSNNYFERSIWVTLVVLLSFFAPGIYYIYYLIRYALGRRPLKGSDPLKPKLSGVPIVQQIEKV